MLGEDVVDEGRVPLISDVAVVDEVDVEVVVEVVDVAVDVPEVAVVVAASFFEMKLLTMDRIWKLALAETMDVLRAVAIRSRTRTSRGRATAGIASVLARIRPEHADKEGTTATRRIF